MEMPPQEGAAAGAALSVALEEAAALSRLLSETQAEAAKLRAANATLVEELFKYRDPNGGFRPYCSFCGQAKIL